MTNLINTIKDSIIKIESTNLNYDFINPYKTPEQILVLVQDFLF